MKLLASPKRSTECAVNKPVATKFHGSPRRPMLKAQLRLVVRELKMHVQTQMHYETFVKFDLSCRLAPPQVNHPVMQETTRRESHTHPASIPLACQPDIN
jgi:hypothetical protein